MQQEKVSRGKTKGKWFNHNRESITRKKDKARREKAQAHAALCVAGLATALASIAAAADTAARSLELDGSKMTNALASATELLATHCSELAESAGADHHLVVSVVQSATNIQTPTQLMTLTAAAATGYFILHSLLTNFYLYCVHVNNSIYYAYVKLSS